MTFTKSEKTFTESEKTFTESEKTSGGILPCKSSRKSQISDTIQLIAKLT